MESNQTSLERLLDVLHLMPIHFVYDGNAKARKRNPPLESTGFQQIVSSLVLPHCIQCILLDHCKLQLSEQEADSP